MTSGVVELLGAENRAGSEGTGTKPVAVLEEMQESSLACH